VIETNNLILRSIDLICKISHRKERAKHPHPRTACGNGSSRIRAHREINASTAASTVGIDSVRQVGVSRAVTVQKTIVEAAETAAQNFYMQILSIRLKMLDESNK